MDNADLIEQCEIEIYQVIYKKHSDGLTYENIRFVMAEIIKSLDIMVYAESLLISARPEKPKKGHERH